MIIDLDLHLSAGTSFRKILLFYWRKVSHESLNIKKSALTKKVLNKCQLFKGRFILLDSVITSKHMLENSDSSAVAIDTRKHTFTTSNQIQFLKKFVLNAHLITLL